MSCYLNFYLKPKDSEKKLFLVDFSRSHPLYQALNDSLAIPFNGGDVEPFVKVANSDVNNVMADLREDIRKALVRLGEYEKYCKNADDVEEIISQKDYIDEMKETLNSLGFLQEITYSIENESYNKFEGLYANCG